MRPRARLVVERLEDRWCPSAPAITSFSATPTTGTTVQLSGYVSDSNPASVQISFGGVMGGTTTANAQGYFTYTGQASGLGTVTAVGVDGQNLTSNQAQTQVASSAPTIGGLTVTYGSQRTVTVTGMVTDENPGNMTINFSGVVSGSTTTNAQGQFSFTTTASALGNFTATTTDLWGLSSSPANGTVSCAAPYFSAFQAVHDYGSTWTISGHVQSQNPGGLTVNLGGLPDLQNVTTTVNSSGDFQITVGLNEDSGTVTANVTDWWGQAAPQANYTLL
jgi:hypothetical protein